MFNHKLRGYQHAAIERTIEAIATGQHAGLWVMPTGTGKTLTFCELARVLDMPTLIVVHRDELIGQTQRALTDCWPGVTIGVVKAERNEWDGPQVVIASVQSMNVRRLETMRRDRFGLVIADEAHHTPAPSWQQIIGYFDKGFLLGVTATPDRLDGKGLAQWFGGEPLFVYSLIRAIDDGYLVRIRQHAVVTETDLDAVATRAGDFAEGDLSEVVNTEARNRAIVEAFGEHASDRRAVVFAVDTTHAYNLALAFGEAGFRSYCLTGKTPTDERRDVLQRFAAGAIQVLCNCEVLTEGFDDPDVDCILMARPTKSRALYTQCVGRGLRLPLRNADKRDCLVLDVTDNCRKHKLVTACSLLGVKKEDAEGEDVLAMAEEEEREEQQRQERLRDDIKGPVVWRLESVCPWPGLPSLHGYRPTSPWHDDDASEKQLHVVKRMGLTIQRPLTKGEASWLIDQCMAYEAAYPSPASSKQQYLLQLHGRWVEGMTKKEASRMIGVIKGEERESA